MNLTAILGQILMVVLILLGFRWYYEYRRDLKKNAQIAKSEGKSFTKPTVGKDIKNGLVWLMIIVIAAIALWLIFEVLHFLFPYWI